MIVMNAQLDSRRHAGHVWSWHTVLGTPAHAPCAVLCRAVLCVPPPSKMFCRSGMEPDDAWGANAELRTDSRQLLGSRYSAPLSVSGSVMGHRGERMAAVSAAMQVWLLGL
jgi:hypothetical protein